MQPNLGVLIFLVEKSKFMLLNLYSARCSFNIPLKTIQSVESTLKVGIWKSFKCQNNEFEYFEHAIYLIICRLTIKKAFYKTEGLIERDVNDYKIF
jgi:hypothetical protein